FGPIVTLALPKSNLPSTVPSTNKSSLPVISPLIRMPWLMHAAARGETGNAETGAFGAGELVGAGALAVLACGKLKLPAAAGCGVSCGFTSSFLHIRHLGGHS